MPRLPKAVVYSDSYTFSSTVSGRAGEVAEVLRHLVPAIRLGRGLHQAHGGDRTGIHQRIDRRFS